MTGHTPPCDQVRADIAALLHDGLSNAAIARETHVCHAVVAKARTALGLPKYQRGQQAAATAEDLFWQRVNRLDDGHMEWTGYCARGVPGLRHAGKYYTAYRLAFRIATGRDPEGNALISCGRDQCVAPGHHADRRDREREEHLDVLHTLIFGTPPTTESGE
ncbi:hypothetical protein [Streptomyces sp. NPDC088794]|uniref:hypothetical protein n=1 Tax=Streptomyces sp. NPDC088794 TaxID=3365902 RepID=UPI0038005730